MSEKSKTTTAKKSTSTTKKTSTSANKTSSAKSSSTKKPSTTAKKVSTTTKKTTTTKKPSTTKKTTTSAKKSSATKTTKTSPAKKPSKKKAIVKAKILSYRRSKRLQKTNQAIAEIIDDFNHKALVGKKFTLKFPDSEATAKGVVISLHGQTRNKQVRLRFENSGMTAHALNQIAEIHI